MHVGIRNTNTVTTRILNSSHQCHWCYGKNPGLLLNEYIFSLPSPCKGTYSIWNLLWSSRFWSSTAVPPIPMTFVTHLILISLSPTPSWFVLYTVLISVLSPSFLLCYCAFSLSWFLAHGWECKVDKDGEKRLWRFLYIINVQTADLVRWFVLLDGRCHSCTNMKIKCEFSLLCPCCILCCCTYWLPT